MLRYVLIALVTTMPAWATAWGGLELTSEKGWCNVYVDGQKMGEIPSNGHRAVIDKLPPGRHHLRITDAFGNDWFNDYVDVPDGALLKAQVEPSGLTMAGVPADPALPSMAPPAGNVAATKVKTTYEPYGTQPTTLYVNSTPPGAPVKVNGADVGVTPLLLTDLPAGRHRLNIGGVPDEVDLKAGGVTRVEVAYAGAPATTTPAGGSYSNNHSTTNIFKLIIDN